MRKCAQCGLVAGDDVLFCPKDGARMAIPSVDGDPDAPLQDPLVGSVVSDRYKVLRRLGEGGMGVVYEAEHVALGKHVALKLLRDDFTRKQDLVERFKQEARSASIIGHENIIDVSDFGEMPGGGIFFAMEMLRGEDLADVLKREGRLPLQRTYRIVGQICRALHAAHQKGIIHRDLKPENVFLVTRGEQQDFVKVLDFGIAKMTTLDGEGRRLTQTGVIFGTPEYMAPEQARGQRLDHRADVYAVGVMTYEMLAGRVPFTGESFMAVLTKHMFDAVPTFAEAAPETAIPSSVEAVVRRALSKERDDRYSTMVEFIEDLTRAMGKSTAPDALLETMPAGAPAAKEVIELYQRISSAGPTQAPTAVAASTRSGRRPRTALWTAVILLLLGGLAAGYFLAFGRTGGAEDDAAPRVVAATGPGLDADDVPPGADAGGAAADEGKGPGAADEGSDAATVEETAAIDGSPKEAGAADGEAEPAEAQPADAPSKGTLIVSASLEGARVTGADGEELCASTPCTLDLAVGTTVELRARKGTQWRGEATVEVGAGTTPVHIELRRADGGGPRPPRDAGGAIVEPPPPPRDIWTLRTDVTL
jgi:serine/threonine-protein kinase